VTNRGALARTFVLGAWTSFFGWLWFTNEKARYLGPRTYWVIPFGSATLAFATIVHALKARKASEGSRERLLPTLALLIPIIAVIAIPAPQLGALAASRKATALGSAGIGSIVPQPQPDGEIDFVDVHYASESAEYAASLGIAEGLDLELTGFVTHGPDAPDGGFDLTRFYVSCCAADAIPYSVRILPDRDLMYPDDKWLHVRGKLAQDADGFFLVPTMVEPIPAPEDPYLY
jgi:uncharacterized repeat protein (TIGR03943 family)